MRYTTFSLAGLGIYWLQCEDIFGTLPNLSRAFYSYKPVNIPLVERGTGERESDPDQRACSQACEQGIRLFTDVEGKTTFMDATHALARYLMGTLTKSHDRSGDQKKSSDVSKNLVYSHWREKKWDA